MPFTQTEVYGNLSEILLVAFTEYTIQTKINNLLNWYIHRSISILSIRLILIIFKIVQRLYHLSLQ